MKRLNKYSHISVSFKEKNGFVTVSGKLCAMIYNKVAETGFLELYRVERIFNNLTIIGRIIREKIR